MKKWRCTVCGYIHEGDAPPEKCPVCGADASKFEEMIEESPQSQASSKDETPSTAGSDSARLEKKAVPLNPYIEFVQTQIMKHHVHPISVHFPNGVTPLSVIFILLAILFGSQNLAQASFYNLIAVILAMPVVLTSGYSDFKKIYGGQRTPLFLTKMVCGAVVSTTSIILVLWYWIDPTVILSPGIDRWIFILILLVMLAAAGLAGFLGGKLVFKD